MVSGDQLMLQQSGRWKQMRFCGLVSEQHQLLLLLHVAMTASTVQRILLQHLQRLTHCFHAGDIGNEDVGMVQQIASLVSDIACARRQQQAAAAAPAGVHYRLCS